MSEQAQQLRALMDAVTSPDAAARVAPEKLVDSARTMRPGDADDVAALHEAAELVRLMAGAGLVRMPEREL